MGTRLRNLLLALGLLLALPLGIVTQLTPPAQASVQRLEFSRGNAYLVLEFLDDDLVHVETATGSPPPSSQALYTSPMVFKTDYGGPSQFRHQSDRFETADLLGYVNPQTLCLSLANKRPQKAYLTTICPADLAQAFKGLTIQPGQMEDIYGLGQEFKQLGSADGDWTALGVREGLAWGNGFQSFQQAAVGNVQIPVYYAVGPQSLNYALFMDNVYRQRWDFTRSPWQARMFGDQLRFYVMTGPDLPDLRSDYMELTGRPPVPPRKAFGLWVSEFGYDTWGQIDALLAGLRQFFFPLDGFVLDLNWFGGVALEDPGRSAMGRLDWDENQEPLVTNNPYFFPDPEQQIRAYAADGVSLAAIEESYLANTTDTFRTMPPDLTVYERTNGVCRDDNQTEPVTNISGFWGIGRMIDWSDPAAGNWIQDQRRWPRLARLGLHTHWTDLGEPENFSPEGCYDGVETTATGLKNTHGDLHNLYNLLWNRSIWEGYRQRQGQPTDLGLVNPRPLILTRSGAAGSQRYGAAMWSGDIAANLESLATHLNAQMHMAFSGIDYYGADIGGFRREVMPYNDRQGRYRGYEDELYTQWLANGAWLDVPVRPHTDNEFVQVNPPYATAPHLIGDRASNLANLRQRYELIPYYYSLAYRAHLYGEPVVPPPVFYYQTDPNLRQVGHQKLIGRDIMVGAVARHGEYSRHLYLPAGDWVNYHSHEWVTSTGSQIRDVPVYREGLLRLPAFVRAGAILPMMVVGPDTRDAFGYGPGNAPPAALLRLQVVADSQPSSFTLFEDDGLTLQYDGAGSPRYHYRTTEMRQQQTQNGVTVVVAPAVDVNGQGPYPGAVVQRAHLVELIVRDAVATQVRLNNQALTEQPSLSALEAAPSGWLNAGRNRILVKSAPVNVYGPEQTFEVTLAPVAAATSVNFVCDRSFTTPGQSTYIVGSLPQLGNWNPQAAIQLDPNIYWDYITNPPPGHRGPGPSAPVWTGVVDGLPTSTAFTWKCLKRSESGSGPVEWEPGANNRFSTTAAGYAGQAYGQF